MVKPYSVIILHMAGSPDYINLVAATRYGGHQKSERRKVTPLMLVYMLTFNMLSI